MLRWATDDHRMLPTGQISEYTGDNLRSIMKKITLIPLLACLVSSSVWADSWIYGGASLGSSDYDNDDSVSYSLFVGTGILPWIGVEGGYVDHGKFKASAGGGDVWSESAYAAIRPNVSFGPLQLYAKAGVNSWILEGDAGVSIPDDDGVDEMWAVGADYSLLGPMSVGVEYSRFSIGNKEVKSINATVTFYFL